VEPELGADLSLLCVCVFACLFVVNPIIHICIPPHFAHILRRGHKWIKFASFCLTYSCAKYKVKYMNKTPHSLSKSSIIAEIPLACSDELAAVEFFEKQRWGANPCCVHCGSVNVYKMVDAKTGERNRRYLWRCRDCKQQSTVRLGTVYEESRLPMRHWAYAFWRACTSKKGVSALEIKRHCQISYKSALFLMNRIRFAMAPGCGQRRSPHRHSRSGRNLCWR